ncbi:MAG: cell division protein FtsQ/DivIB [Candidatus Kapaibacterium sp.]
MADKQLRLHNIEKNKRYSLYSQLLTILIIIGGVFALAVMWKSKQRLQEVRITGTTALSKQEILDISGLDTSDHPFLKDIELAEIRQNIRKHPFIRSVTVAHGDNGLITIAVDERFPIAAVKSSAGDLQYIDREGKILPYRLFSIVSDVPIVHGIETVGKIDSSALDGLVRLLNELQQAEHGEVYQQISEIVYDAHHGSFTLRSADAGFLVPVGKAERAKEKFSNLYSFLTKELPKLPKNSIEYIDLRWTDQLVVKKKTVASNSR